MTGAAFAVASMAFALAGFGQHTVHQLDPRARARLNSAFIAVFFVGGALGSQLGSLTYHFGDWTAVTALGVALPLPARTGPRNTGRCSRHRHWRRRSPGCRATEHMAVRVGM